MRRTILFAYCTKFCTTMFQIIPGQRDPSRPKRHERINDGGRRVPRGVPHAQAGDGARARLPSPPGDHAGLRALPLQDPGGEPRPGATDGG